MVRPRTSIDPLGFARVKLRLAYLIVLFARKVWFTLSRSPGCSVVDPP